jgi:hypothetical protein
MPKQATSNYSNYLKPLSYARWNCNRYSIFLRGQPLLKISFTAKSRQTDPRKKCEFEPLSNKTGPVSTLNDNLDFIVNAAETNKRFTFSIKVLMITVE